MTIIELAEPGGRRHRFYPSMVRIGLERMAEQRPVVFGQLMSGNYDAAVGDTLVQLAVFGEVKYG